MCSNCVEYAADCVTVVGKIFYACTDDLLVRGLILVVYFFTSPLEGCKVF